MWVIAWLHRVLLIAALAVGFGVPVPVMAAPALSDHAHHHAMAPAAPQAQDEACRAHCLGVTLLASAPEPPPRAERAHPIRFAALVTKAPSLWPQPEGHPPRR